MTAAARVRTAGPADAEVVGTLLRDFNDEFAAPGPPAAELARRFRALLRREDVLVVLAESPGGEAVGFVFLTLRPTPYADGPVALLEELYVRPALRDRGIGTLLLTRSMALCRDRSALELQVNVDEVDTDARRFYERYGFSNVEQGGSGRMFFYERTL